MLAVFYSGDEGPFMLWLLHGGLFVACFGGILQIRWIAAVGATLTLLWLGLLVCSLVRTARTIKQMRVFRVEEDVDES